jgi:tetratricopeptide (TPR) repeat protein
MMKTLILSLLMALSLHGLTGCAGFFMEESQTKVEDTGEIPILLSKDAQQQALVDEKNKKYLDALGYWTQARATLDRKIFEISQITIQVSQDHSRQGIMYYEKKEADKALGEFLEALTYNPANKIALDYLRNRYEISRYMPYTIRKDDTFASIAKKIYGSPAYAFMVAEFSNAGKEKDLAEGKVIRLADKDSFSSKVLVEYNKNLADARKFYKAEKYAEAVIAARAILTNHPEDKEAFFIINTSFLKIASIQKERQDYEGAIATLSQVDPSFRNEKKEIADIRELLKNSRSDFELKKNHDFLQKGEKLYSEGKYLEAREAL